MPLKFNILYSFSHNCLALHRWFLHVKNTFSKKAFRKLQTSWITSLLEQQKGKQFSKKCSTSILKYSTSILKMFQFDFEIFRSGIFQFNSKTLIKIHLLLLRKQNLAKMIGLFHISNEISANVSFYGHCFVKLFYSAAFNTRLNSLKIEPGLIFIFEVLKNEEKSLKYAANWLFEKNHVKYSVARRTGLSLHRVGHVAIQHAHSFETNNWCKLCMEKNHARHVQSSKCIFIFNNGRKWGGGEEREKKGRIKIDHYCMFLANLQFSRWKQCPRRSWSCWPVRRPRRRTVSRADWCCLRHNGAAGRHHS